MRNPICGTRQFQARGKCQTDFRRSPKLSQCNHLRYNRALNRVGSRPDDPFHFFN